MAAMLGAFARLVREKPAGAARVLMACTVDEEHGFAGVTRLTRSPFVTAPDLPLVAVVAEPTCLEIVNSHKGAVRWDVEVTGRPCHSSRPQLGINAIYHMAELLQVIRALCCGTFRDPCASNAGAGDAQRRHDRRRQQRQHGCGTMSHRNRSASAARRRCRHGSQRLSRVPEEPNSPGNRVELLCPLAQRRRSALMVPPISCAVSAAPSTP